VNPTRVDVPDVLVLADAFAEVLVRVAATVGALGTATGAVSLPITYVTAKMIATPSSTATMTSGRLDLGASGAGASGGTGPLGACWLPIDHDGCGAVG
jgi:hypothetical protein